MGTRHLQRVIDKNGVEKIRQYGQWDGYPDGQGLGILEYLLTANLEKYQLELEKINEITEEQIEYVDSIKHWWTEFPHLHRDCGCEIHKMIEEGLVEFVMFFTDDPKEVRCLIEGFYTIDFKRNVFMSKYYDNFTCYKLDDLPTVDQYLKDMGVGKDEEEE